MYSCGFQTEIIKIQKAASLIVQNRKCSEPGKGENLENESGTNGQISRRVLRDDSSLTPFPGHIGCNRSGAACQLASVMDVV